MSLYDLTPPAAEPLGLEEAKTYLRVDTIDDDTLISSLIMAARHRVENWLDLSLITRSFIWRTNIPSGQTMCLPRPPLIRVDRVSLIGEGDQAVDVPATDYSVTTRRKNGELALKPDKNWSDYLGGFSTLEIEFSAGFGSEAQDIPEPIRQAIRLLVVRYYEFREARPDEQLPFMVSALLSEYKKVRL